MKLEKVTVSNWMTSKGLDFDTRIFSELESKIVVTWGNIVGNFVSYSSKEKALIFSTDVNEDIFSLVENSPKFASLEIGTKMYKIEWSTYNYTILLEGNKLFVTVGESDEKEIIGN